jgi:hypothetical protein
MGAVVIVGGNTDGSLIGVEETTGSISSSEVAAVLEAI